MSSKTDLAYMAGFLDAEGSIGISDIKKFGSGAIRVTVYNTQIDAVLLFQNAFGGSVRLHKRVQDRDGVLLATNGCVYHPNPLYIYDVRAVKAETILKALLPYLRLKLHKAQLALEYRKTKGKCGKKLTKETLQRRAELRRQIHQGRR